MRSWRISSEQQLTVLCRLLISKRSIPILCAPTGVSFKCQSFPWNWVSPESNSRQKLLTDLVASTSCLPSESNCYIVRHLILVDNPHLSVPVWGQAMWVNSGISWLSQAFRWLKWLSDCDCRRDLKGELPSWTQWTQRWRDNDSCCKPLCFKLACYVAMDNCNSDYRQNSEILQVWFWITAIKQMLQ